MIIHVLILLKIYIAIKIIFQLYQTTRFIY